MVVMFVNTHQVNDQLWLKLAESSAYSGLSPGVKLLAKCGLASSIIGFLAVLLVDCHTMHKDNVTWDNSDRRQNVVRSIFFTIIIAATTGICFYSAVKFHSKFVDASNFDDLTNATRWVGGYFVSSLVIKLIALKCIREDTQTT